MSLESSTTCRIILSELYWLWHIHWVFSDVWMEAEQGDLALNAKHDQILVPYSFYCFLLTEKFTPILYLVRLACRYLPSQCTSCIQNWCSILISPCCKFHFSLKLLPSLLSFTILWLSFAVFIFEQEDCCFSMTVL